MTLLPGYSLRDIYSWKASQTAIGVGLILQKCLTLHSSALTFPVCSYLDNITVSCLVVLSFITVIRQTDNSLRYKTANSWEFQ